MATNNNRLKLGEKIAYGMGDSAANVYVAMASTFMTGYYTDTVGLAAAAVGTMMLLARVFDGVTDLMMGALVDRTTSRFGKARPWLLWTAPFMFIGLIALFSVPKSFYGTNAGLIYAYISYIFMNCIVYTANNLPYNALLSRMTLNVQDRASTASIRFVMTQFTTLIINAVTANLVGSLGWTKLAAVYGVIELAMLIWCFVGCKEHIDEDVNTGNVEINKVPLKEAVPALLKNKYFYLQAVLFLVLYISVVCSGATNYYFCNTVLGNMGVITLVSMATTIPAMIYNFVNPIFVQKFGKRKMMIVGSALMIIGSIVIGAAGANLPMVMVGLVIKGFGMGPIMSGIFAMTADVVDYGEWKTGVRSEGLVNSCTSFGMKVGIGLGSAISAWILAFGGYDGTAAVQSESAVAAIRFSFGYFGAILAAVCFVIILAMNIDKYIVQIQSDLEAKREGK
ncbi:MAG: glycoside-pentoside-hexuronide (GPH):cation symporter [Lachnospiraceae bacterium]|nr:glycoside-pentoside-hexuronide (GPH):cation symporter [Lachnospiraceae bacterium]